MGKIIQKNNSSKHCIKCNCELTLGSNFTEYRKNKCDYICNGCQLKRTDAWRKANPERFKKDDKKYKQSTKGRVTIRRYNAKRKRNLGYIELFDNPFDKDILVVGHHISDAFVVYIPKSLHLNHLHGKYREKHRDELKPYVEEIYDISYIIEKDGE